MLPDYDDACTSNLIPALLDPDVERPSWLAAEAVEADQVVVLVLDGLGWEQLQARRSLMPTLAAMQGGRITTVCPTTTATALTSITTGLPPGEHGVIGYRMAVGRDVLNVLRWSTHRGDARQAIPARSICDAEPFVAQRPPIVVRAEFEHSGFSDAHLFGSRFVGYRMPSTMAIEVARLLRAGEPFVYAYYDGIDKVAHERGFGPFYDAELVAVDRLVADVIAALPSGAVLVVTADHGQVQVGDAIVTPHPDVLRLVHHQSGEGRFRWLHARQGATAELAAAAEAAHGDVAWVVTRERLLDEGWFGPVVSPPVQARLGDVALVTHADVSFDDPADSGPFQLQCRHGSLTAAEVYVPVIAATS